MKAKDYYKNFVKDFENDTENPVEQLFVKQIKNMIFEISEIREKRNAKKDSAMIAIFKETEQKAKAFIKLININEGAKYNFEFAEDSFKKCVKKWSPELYSVVFK